MCDCLCVCGVFILSGAWCFGENYTHCVRNVCVCVNKCELDSTKRTETDNTSCIILCFSTDCLCERMQQQQLWATYTVFNVLSPYTICECNIKCSNEWNGMYMSVYSVTWVHAVYVFFFHFLSPAPIVWMSRTNRLSREINMLFGVDSIWDCVA